MHFSELGLSPKVLAAVEAAGYAAPTEIQAHAIPFALQGRDVLGIAQTGTGKTAAFTLPMLTRLERGRARARMPRSLVLEPTRELAAQVAEALETYGANNKMNVVLLIGGVSFGDQDKKLDRGADIVIATPGRLLDHFERGKLMLSGLEILVVDEADRMLDMGFIPDIERIFKLTPFTRQTLFFSATMPPEIQRLTDTFLHAPERIEVSRPATVVATITQKLLSVPNEPAAKRDRFRQLLRSLDITTSLIFCNRKSEVRILHRSLAKHGFDAGAIHGDMDQHARMETLERFRSGTLKYLVASDVAARGLDIPAVSHVFNFDVPHHAEDYVHRIGRTGRAGRKGAAYTLVSRLDSKALGAIESLIGQSIEWVEKPAVDAEPEPEAAGERGRGRGERRGRRGATTGRSQDAAERRTTSRGAGERPTAANGEGRPKAAAANGDHAPERRPERAAPHRERAEPRRRPRETEPERDVVFAETADVPDFLRRSMMGVLAKS